MKKKKGLTFLLGMLLLVTGISTQNTYAQKTAAINGDAKSDEPQKPAQKSVLQTYIDLSALPIEERRKIFGNVSPEERAAIVRFHLAFQLVKRPDLNSEQKALIGESISIIKPDTYSRPGEVQSEIIALDARIKAAFSERKRDGLEIFGNIGGTKDDVAILQKYEDLIPLNDLQRKEVFRKSTAVEKQGLWRVHTALYLARHFDLTVSQKSFIADWLDFLTLEVFELSPKDQQWEAKVGKPLNVLTEKILQAFSKEEAGNLVARLGEPQKGGATISTEGLPAPEMDDCGCHRGTGDQCWGGECWGNVCKLAAYGCGIGWLQSCNGTKCT